MENSETNPLKYRQLMSDKEVEEMHWRKDSLLTSLAHQSDSYCVHDA